MLSNYPNDYVMPDVICDAVYDYACEIYGRCDLTQEELQKADESYERLRDENYPDSEII